MKSISSKHIFVVDDEPTIAYTLGKILSFNGYEVTTFTNPLFALRDAAVRSPDLLISDVMMPGLTGVELAIQVKALWPPCKVLLFSGQAATADLLKDARESGHDFCILEKPVHPSDLLQQVRAQGASFEPALCQ